ncbi:MAG: hypothetical protein Q8K24_05935 [Hydrogenophaga sp.]|nr:hypothetical protein [Hydrogenophaga sp.]
MSPGALIITLLAMVAALLGGAAWHDRQVEAFRAEVLSAGHDDSVRLLGRGNAALTQKLQESDRARTADKQKLVDLERRLAAAKRMRASEHADFVARAAAATEAELRAYAQVCDGIVGESRSLVERFGREAIACAIDAEQLERDVAAYADHWVEFVEAVKGDAK